MHFQTLIFLFCLSVMLHPGETQGGQGGKPKPVQPVQPAKPELEITKCDPKIELAGYKDGFYYYEDTTKGYQELGEVKTNTKTDFGKPLTPPQTGPLKVIRVAAEAIMDKDYDLWEVKCTGVFKVKATGNLPVAEKTPTVKKPENKITPKQKITFETSKGPVDAQNVVTLGDQVTLKMTADSQKFKHIIVNNCSVSEGKNKVEIYKKAIAPAPAITTANFKVDTTSTKGNKFVATFEAFRFVSQKNDLTFECEVLLCTDNDRKICTDQTPGVHPGSPILYDVSENVKRNTVGGVLAVHLPGEEFNSAGKASSCVSGLLLTTGAVLLQRQFV